MKKANDFMFKVLDVAKKAQPLVYTDANGDKHTQEMDEYSSSYTHAILKDIKDLAEDIREMDRETSEMLLNTYAIISYKDVILRRLFDDIKDNRPLTNYEFADTDLIIDELAEMREKYKEHRDMIKSWVIQITQIDTWAYYLTAYKEASDTLKKANNGLLDISEEDIGLVRVLLSMVQIMLKCVIKLPLEEAMSSDCIDKIEMINAFVKAVIEKDKKTLDAFYKYFDAVNDFCD